MREPLPLGPNTNAMLRRVGINSANELRELGAVRAYVRVKQSRANAQFASFTVLCELEGALTNRPWRAVAEHDRDRLLSQVKKVEWAERFRDRLPRAIFGVFFGAAVAFIAWSFEPSPWWWVSVPVITLMTAITEPPSGFEGDDNWGSSDSSDFGDGGGGGDSSGGGDGS